MFLGKRIDAHSSADLAEHGIVVEQVLRFLSQQDLPPTPVNYELGYLRFMDADSLAARAIDAVLISGERVGQDQADHIVSAYRSLSGAPVDRSKAPAGTAPDDRLRHQALKLADLAADAVGATGQFGSDLSCRLEALGNDSGPFTAIVTAMIDQSSVTEQQLKLAQSRIDVLNAEVAAAKDDAARDTLTGLINRRGLEAQVAALEVDSRTALAICDIDHFKAINDRHGHLVGDRVLKAVADSIAESCEPHVVGRWGGEEFVILMNDVSLTEADTIIRSANERLQARAFRVRETDQLVAPITFSAGVVMVEGTAMDAAIAVADTLLYRAKESGRNRVICEETPNAGLGPD